MGTIVIGSILVVCTGNVCRSPLGAALLARSFPDKTVTSAGLKALTGASVDEQIAQIASGREIDLSGHRARQATPALCRSHDLILVMEKKQLERISRLAYDVRGKTFLYGHWLDKADVPDPYKRSVEMSRLIYDLLERSCNEWVKVIKRNEGKDKYNGE